MTDIKKLLGSNIKNYRSALGHSQAALAEKAGIATNYLGLIEGGKKFPSADIIQRIAEALKKDTPELFTIAPVQQEWKIQILASLEQVISRELDKAKKA